LTVTSEQQMVLFTLLSFLSLGLGAIALSVMTLIGKGNRSFAIFLAGSTIALGLFMFFGLDQSGILASALGIVALVIALLPGKRS
jgi:hypothetical protein